MRVGYKRNEIMAVSSEEAAYWMDMDLSLIITSIITPTSALGAFFCFLLLLKHA